MRDRRLVEKRAVRAPLELDQILRVLIEQAEPRRCESKMARAEASRADSLQDGQLVSLRMDRIYDEGVVCACAHVYVAAVSGAQDMRVA